MTGSLGSRLAPCGPVVDTVAAERAHVRYAPGEVDVGRLITTIVKTGFTADVSTADTRADEKAKKFALYRDEVRRFWISAALTLPLPVALSVMAC